MHCTVNFYSSVYIDLTRQRQAWRQRLPPNFLFCFVLVILSCWTDLSSYSGKMFFSSLIVFLFSPTLKQRIEIDPSKAVRSLVYAGSLSGPRLASHNNSAALYGKYISDRSARKFSLFLLIISPFDSLWFDLCF